MKIEELAKIIYPLINILETAEAKREMVEYIVDKLYPGTKFQTFPKPPIIQIWEELLELSQYDLVFESASEPELDGYNWALENL